MINGCGSAAVVALAEIRYANRARINGEDGAGSFERARGLFLQNLTATMPVKASTYSGGGSDFVLAKCTGDELEALLDSDAMARAQACLAKPLDPQMRLLDPHLWIQND
jgi:hypothetical protein